MFHSARLKLTAWYLAIIMVISLLFSLIIYADINRELTILKHLQKPKLDCSDDAYLILPPPRRIPELDHQTISAAQERLTFILFLINIGILGISGIAAYFLAGKTLAPIKEMVDEQNRFITDASHELRTPLTSLRSEIEVNLRDKSLGLNNAKALLKSNLEEVVNLQLLSNHLMELASYQKKNGGFIFEKISLVDIITIACRKITPLADEKHIAIKNEVEDFKFEGNKQSLIELIVILLDNAVKYSNNNTIVTIRSQKADHLIKLSVKDEGIGIDAVDLPYIFDRFYRADKSRSKEKTTGYGLGLSIAKKIVDLHKGSIQVESKLNKGSIFTVTLPIK